jgi:hypothetical protein
VSVQFTMRWLPVVRQRLHAPEVMAVVMAVTLPVAGHGLQESAGPDPELDLVLLPVVDQGNDP